VVDVGGVPHTIRALRKVDRGHQVAFEEAVDRDAAERLRSADITVARRRAAEEGEFWPEDLIGLAVRPGGGTVVGLVHGPTQSRLEIERDGGRFEIPFVIDLVPVVDVEGGFVEIVEIPGLTEP
jgi:16S rRNA processing protein RimM